MAPRATDNISSGQGHSSIDIPDWHTDYDSVTAIGTESARTIHPDDQGELKANYDLREAVRALIILRLSVAPAFETGNCLHGGGHFEREGTTPDATINAAHTPTLMAEHCTAILIAKNMFRQGRHVPRLLR